MSREEALTLLSSGSSHLRRTAARLLAREAHSGDLPALRAARAAEADHYARGALDRAIARLTEVVPVTGDSVADEETEESKHSKQQIQARATEWVAGLLLHELAPQIGLLAFAASREVPGFEQSRTRSHIVTLQKVCSAIEQLRKASATPKPVDLDLAALIRQIVEEEFAESRELIALHGPQPTLLKSDDALLRFAICNGLRNAIEAVAGAQNAAQPLVIIAWGETDVDCWVSVLDRGVGISASIENVFGIGKTTKQGHSGFGLPIAAAAIEALGGTVSLQPATGGGTKYELRWDR